ncbi:MAG: hypothetical protein U9Q21_02490 [Candidatus Auribacterota bacterium]|nr:hypothetical protein [Candidatus Auribacterota bacterium]
MTVPEFIEEVKRLSAEHDDIQDDEFFMDELRRQLKQTEPEWGR